MNNINYKQLLSLYGLKWNPFSQEIPHEALISTPAIDQFIWKVENLVSEGGFALITGEPGIGKSVVLRILAKKLQSMQNIQVAECTRPQSRVGDFYRELGALFAVQINFNNHWFTFAKLREQWKNHIESSLLRPVILIDEAQEMSPYVLSELRIMSSMHLDSQCVLAVILAGDHRLPEKFRSPDLLPLGSRIRTRLNLEPYSKEQLLNLLAQSLSLAGAPNLMTKDLMLTLAEHAAGNPRVLNNIAAEILLLGAKKEVSVLDEALFFEVLPIRKRA